MLLCFILLAFTPFFNLQAQTTTQETLSLSYQDSETTNTQKQARFTISLKSEKNLPLSLKGKTVVLFKSSSCSGDQIEKQENTPTDTLNFHIAKRYFEANKLYYLSAGITTKDNVTQLNKTTTCSKSLVFTTNSYSSLVDPKPSAENTPPIDSSLKIELIEAETPGVPSIRLRNMINTQERIHVFTTPDCTGSELTKKTVAINNLKSSKDVHLSANDYSEIKTYTLSAKTDNSSCSNSIQYKKVPVVAPNVTFLMNGSNTGNTSQIKFDLLNLQKKDVITIYQNDTTCTKDSIKQVSAEDNSLFVTASLLSGDQSPNATYSFYAQAKRGDSSGQCVGPLNYTFNKTPPTIATLTLEGNAKSFNRTPQFIITNLEVGNSAYLILGSNCVGNSMADIKKVDSSTTPLSIGIKERDFLNVDKLYMFSAKVIDSMGNSSCSNSVEYTLITQIPDPTIQLLVNDQTTAKTLANPSFRIGNISPGDKVEIYKDKICSKIASEEKTISKNQTTIDIQITSLNQAEKNTYYAKVFSNAVQNTKCSSNGVPYEYKPPAPVIASDPIYVSSTSTNGGTPPLPDTKIDDENKRILQMGLNLESQVVTNFYVTELGYNAKEIEARTAAIRDTLDSAEYKKDPKPWLNTDTDQLVPYVKKNDNTYISIGGHTVNRILYNLQTQNPQSYQSLTTYSRIVRDYTELKLTDQEIENDMIKSGFVWLHDLTQEQVIIRNQKSYTNSNSPSTTTANIAKAYEIVSTVNFCDTSVKDLILDTSDPSMGTFYCVDPFNPSKLYTNTFSDIISKKTKDMKPDPYLSIVYYLKNGRNPYDSTKKDISMAPFNRLGILSFPPDREELENKVIEYLDNLTSKPEYLFQDSKWALYLKYRLQRDFTMNYTKINLALDSFSKNPTYNSEFGKNICRAYLITQDLETYKIAKNNPNWLPGYKWNSINDLPDQPPTWCLTYNNSINSNKSIISTVNQ